MYIHTRKRKGEPTGGEGWEGTHWPQYHLLSKSPDGIGLMDYGLMDTICSCTVLYGERGEPTVPMREG